MARIMLPARVDSCAPAMEFLREHLAADHAGILGFVELAVEELLVNVATYAYAGPCPQEGDRNAHWGQMELGFKRVKNVSAHHCYSGDDGTNTIELYFQLARDEN